MPDKIQTPTTETNYTNHKTQTADNLQNPSTIYKT